MSLQARYTPGTDAYDSQRAAYAQREVVRKRQQYETRRLAQWRAERPRRPLVVHPRWPVPLRGTVAIGLFYGLRRTQAI